MEDSFWPKDNPSSWAEVFRLIDLYPNDSEWLEYKRSVKEILDRCIAENLHEDFRAGMSMQDVVLSTALQHGLKRGDPQVVLCYSLQQKRFSVAYARRALIWGDPVPIEHAESISEAHALLLRYMLRLWRETKPQLPLPPGLGGAG